MYIYICVYIYNMHVYIISFNTSPNSPPAVVPRSKMPGWKLVERVVLKDEGEPALLVQDQGRLAFGEMGGKIGWEIESLESFGKLFETFGEFGVWRFLELFFWIFGDSRRWETAVLTGDLWWLCAWNCWQSISLPATCTVSWGRRVE